MHEIAIIGSGPAGYTAGIYAGRASLSPVLFEGLESGGQLMLTTDVENYPGFEEGVMGPELMQVFKKQAQRFGTEIKTETIDSIEKIDGGFQLKSSKDTYEFKTVVISTGASAKWLGVKGEKELQGYGVSACATCDGFFFKELEVVVVGGGDSAMEEALFLTKFAKKVHVIIESVHTLELVPMETARTSPGCKSSTNFIVVPSRISPNISDAFSEEIHPFFSNS